MKKRAPPAEVLALLADYLDYDPATGVLSWAIGPSDKIKAGRLIASKNSHGYVHFTFKGICFSAHSAIWYLQTGAWPVATIDHRNLDRGDNRWENLREATYGQNTCNRPKRPHTPAKGVRRDRSKWRADIRHEHRRVYLGSFDTVEEASAAYVAAAQRLHGEFARLE